MTGQTGRLVLLASSKTVRRGGDGPTWTQSPLAEGPLAPLRKRLVRESQAAAKETAGAFFDASGAPLDAACELALAIGRAPTMPAHARYDGQQWATFRNAGGRAERVIVMSGLWGPVRANTPIPAYRLPCGGRRADGSTVAAAWRASATRCVCAMADGNQVIDLLSPESRAALDIDELRAETRVVQVEFLGADDAPIHSVRLKQARGALAAHVSRGGGPSAFTESPGHTWSWTRSPTGWSYAAR